MNEKILHTRILILGCPGSGKTTFALSLAKELGLPLFQMDKLYWKKKWTRPSPEEFISQLRSVVEKTEWIIEGNYFDYLKVRAEKAQLVFLLECSTYRCLYRTFIRGLKRSFLSRKLVEEPHLFSNRKFSIDLKFIKKIITFNRTTKKAILSHPALDHCELVLLNSNKKLCIDGIIKENFQKIFTIP